jgi:hypothetical protein
MPPFPGLFDPVRLDGDRSSTTSILFAMIVYGTVALALDALIEWLTVRILELPFGDAAARRRAGEPA